MRLIDLHVDWLLQYARETVVFDPALYPGGRDRLGQAEGYLQATRRRSSPATGRPRTGPARPTPGRPSAHLIARIEAEFSGRLLIGPDDFDRWQDDPDGLAWGLIGVEGFDALIRSAADLAGSPACSSGASGSSSRSTTATSLLGGSSSPGDDRGLTDLGRAFLDTLAGLAPDGAGPRPILDLAHLNPAAVVRRPRLVRGRPGPAVAGHPGLQPRGPGPRGLRLPEGHPARQPRAGSGPSAGSSAWASRPPFFESPDQVQAAIEAVAALPFEGRAGFEGIAIGTDFLGVDATLPGLGNAAEVVAWVQADFDRPTAAALLHDNARALIARAVRRPIGLIAPIWTGATADLAGRPIGSRPDRQASDRDRTLAIVAASRYLASTNGVDIRRGTVLA